MYLHVKRREKEYIKGQKKASSLFIYIKENVKMKNYLHMAWRQKKSEKKGKSLYVCMLLKYKTKFMYLNN